MTVKVLGYIADDGDGSNSIRWVKESDQEVWEEWVESDEYYDTYHDGDGLTHRATLTFDNYEAAEAAGIKFSTVEKD